MLQSIPLTPLEALSGVAGSISLASWIFLLVPQLVQNYKSGSAAGVSLLFIVVWMIGDIANLVGAIWGQLVPTVTALAVYFCFADAILICQCLYYNTLNARRERRRSMAQESGLANEEDPLLASTPQDQQEQISSLGLPGSRRRSSASRRSKTSHHSAEALAQIIEEEKADKSWLRNTISVVLIFLAGAAGWAIAYKLGAWKPTPVTDGGDDESMPLGAAISGYASAVLYLGARLPQIAKNYREKSCEGLSLLFFVLSIIGNLTYGMGILLHSVEKNYFLKNLPWLIGSLGTMAEDAVIFYQFHKYGDKQSAIN